ncbi:MAG TPA: DUF4129 domain-containing protein, partial [Holophagaceae bacterium]|nr:DUF4129 domain-containing protein [Holophagaceae bacterium]
GLMALGTQGFVPRLRRPMEALDLGLSLLQAHLGAVAAVWALQLGLLLLLILPFTWRHPLLALPWLWWLKPWLDRGTLFVLSRSVFGQPASLWDFIGEGKAVHRRGLLAGLLWRRLSPARSFLLPIFQLEGLGGAAYRTRASVLQRQGGGIAALLTFAGLFFTVLTFLGSIGILQAMLPPGTHLNLWNLFGEALPTWFTWVLFALGLVALTLTEPFYVAAGFALYLNRRTQLEGWDLELAFRRLASRLAALLLVVGLAVGLPARAQATPEATASEPAPEAEPSIPEKGPIRPQEEALLRAQRVLREDPAFSHTREERRLVYRPSGKEPQWLKSLLDALFGPSKPKERTPSNTHFPEGLGELIALLGKIILVAGIAALLLWLLYKYRHHLGVPKVAQPEWEAPEAVAGHDIRPESLPADLPAAARALFAAGEARAALALLYRGALADLVHRRGLEIPASATEGDCLRAARIRMERNAFDTFDTLSRLWLRLAYKAEAPSLEAFESLCAAWPLAFGGRP